VKKHASDLENLDYKSVMTSLIIFFLSAIVVVLISCSKDKGSITLSDQKILLVKKHAWILDSVNTRTSNYNVMQPANSFQLYLFKTDTLTITFNSLSYDLIIDYEAPEKVYYWFPNETKDINTFMTIVNVNEKNLVTKDTNTYSHLTQIRYCHSQ
jgi:hypothetical protein